MQKSDTKEELRWRWGTKRRADKAGGGGGQEQHVWTSIITAAGETGLPPSLLAPQKHTLRLFPLQSCSVFLHHLPRHLPPPPQTSPRFIIQRLIQRSAVTGDAGCDL